MTSRQQELLALMRHGWAPVVYRDDPRTRYLPPDRHPMAARRGNAHTVLALLRRGFIKVKNGTAGATEYELDSKGMACTEPYCPGI